jgi:hypothetical protein
LAKADTRLAATNIRFGGKAPQAALVACVIWRGFERGRNTNALRHRECRRFELSAHYGETAKEDGADDQEVCQNWHSHPDVSKLTRLEIWLGLPIQPLTVIRQISHWINNLCRILLVAPVMQRAPSDF